MPESSKGNNISIDDMKNTPKEEEQIEEEKDIIKLNNNSNSINNKKSNNPLANFVLYNENNNNNVTINKPTNQINQFPTNDSINTSNNIISQKNINQIPSSIISNDKKTYKSTNKNIDSSSKSQMQKQSLFDIKNNNNYIFPQHRPSKEFINMI